MTILQPVDFKAVAAKGAYVYCYLRADGTPYYVGIGTTPTRPFQKNHNCMVPSATKDRWRARLMRSGLTWEMACEWEQRYIARFGRKDQGGILWNRTDGGDGRTGYVPTQEEKEKAAASRRIHFLAEVRAGRINSYGIDAEVWLELALADRAAVRYFCTTHPEVSGVDYLAGNYSKWQGSKEGVKHQQEAAAKAALISKKISALAFGIPCDLYATLTKQQRDACKAWMIRHPGKTAADYFAADQTKSRSAASVLSKQKVAAAKHGLTLEEWQSLTIFQRDTCKKDREKAALIGAPYFEYLAMSKGEKISATKRVKALAAAA